MTATGKMTPGQVLSTIHNRNHQLWIENKQLLAVAWFTERGMVAEAAERRAALEKTQAKIAELNAALEAANK